MYGRYNPDMSILNDTLAAWKGNDKDLFFESLEGYGITAFEPMNVSRGALFDASACISVLRPYNVGFRRSPTDSVHFQIKGWNAMFSILGKDVIPGKTVALVLSPGWDFGMLKMIESKNGNGSKLTNFYISPLARAEMRFVFGPISLGARGVYRYNLLKGDWHSKSTPVLSIPGVKSTGTSLEFFFGIGHVHYQ